MGMASWRGLTAEAQRRRDRDGLLERFNRAESQRWGRLIGEFLAEELYCVETKQAQLVVFFKPRRRRVAEMGTASWGVFNCRLVLSENEAGAEMGWLVGEMLRENEGGEEAERFIGSDRKYQRSYGWNFTTVGANNWINPIEIFPKKRPLSRPISFYKKTKT